MKEQPKSIPVFLDYKTQLTSFTNEEIGAIFMALFEYAETGSMESFPDRSMNVMLLTMCGGVDRNNAWAAYISERNRENINKRWGKQKDTSEYDRIQPNTTVCEEYDRIRPDTAYTIQERIGEEKKGQEKREQEILCGADKPRKNTRFIPPTLDEVTAYIVEKGYAVDAGQFHSYYSEAGWHDKDGKPVKNWKQKIISWHGRDNPKQATQTGASKERGIPTDDEYKQYPPGWEPL